MRVQHVGRCLPKSLQDLVAQHQSATSLHSEQPTSQRSQCCNEHVLGDAGRWLALDVWTNSPTWASNRFAVPLMSQVLPSCGISAQVQVRRLQC